MSKSASAASPTVATKPVRKVHTIRPVKAKALTSAVEGAAAYAAYQHQHKATPAKADWNKIVQQIGLSLGYLRVPYAFGLTLLPVWTAAYKAAQKGHVPAKPVTIPKKAPKAPAKAKPSSEPTYTKAQVAEAVAAAIASLTA